MPIATIADAPTAAAARYPVQCFSHRRPKSTLARNAASGNAGMSQTFWIIPSPSQSACFARRPAQGWWDSLVRAKPGLARCSSFHLVDLVHVHRRAIAIRGEDDRKPHRDLGRGDDEHEDHEDASPLVERVARAELTGPAAEGHEREVARVQHQLDAHED